VANVAYLPAKLPIHRYKAHGLLYSERSVCFMTLVVIRLFTAKVLTANKLKMLACIQ